MNTSLTWSHEEGRVCLKGRIDENADLEVLSDELSQTEVTMDLSGILRINSIGVRTWMDFVASRKLPLRLVRCPPVFVEQLNTISNFAGMALVLSVQCAYECDADAEVCRLEVSTADARARHFPPAPHCPRCGDEMIVAQESDSYFRFLRY